MTARARIAEIPIGEAQAAEEEHLEKPVEDDGDLAEKERPGTFGDGMPARRQRKRSRAPRSASVRTVAARRMFSASGSEMNRHFVVVRWKTVANDDAEHDEIRQNAQQQRQAIVEHVALEPQIEAGQQRSRGRQRVMRCDQQVTQGQIAKDASFC